MARKWRRRLGWLLLAAGLTGACAARQPESPPILVKWRLNPDAAVVGPARLTITLRETSGRAIPGATVHLEAHMTHPGMAPALSDGVELAPGLYEVPFAFTMRGDWVLLVSAVLPDGGRLERRIDVSNVRPSG